MEQIKDKMTQIFRTLFENQNLVLEPHMTAADIDGWDSFTHLQLLVSVEKEFGIKISGAEIMRLKNVGDLINLVQSKTA